MILRTILISWLVSIFLSYGLLVSADDNNINTSTVGGECTYKQYDGSARITSITQKNYSNNDSYIIKFVFYPNQEITEPFAQFESRELILLTKAGVYPNTSFLQENGIEVDKYFNCILKVIVNGRCTPTIFEFPTFTN